MQKNRWQKIGEIFKQAVVLPIEERQNFVEEICRDDKDLCREVLQLIVADTAKDNLLDERFLSLGVQILEADDFQINESEFSCYRVKKLLGRGGMGAVYLAEDVRLGRPVALKILPSSLGENPEHVQRFRQEARTASSISHPNVAHIYEFGEESERYFLAMEYVEGKTLRELLKKNPIDVAQIVKITLQIAEALVATHKRSIIHRDIKPENIIVTESGLVKVLDFGVAKLIDFQLPGNFSMLPETSLVNTTPGMIMGTIGYMSPEQLQNKKVDFRADIWSVGVVLYEMLAGRKPFEGKTAKEISKAITKKEPVPISFSKILPDEEASLKRIIARTLNKRVSLRYESAEELAFDLQQIKQKLEFHRHLSVSEIIDDAVTPYNFKKLERTQNSNFIEKSKQSWTQQSFSRKATILASLIVLLTFTVGVSIQYLSSFYVTQPPKFETFSPDSRSRLQISTLFGIRKKLESSIPFISFSPNGKSISFVMSGEGTDDIYIKQLNQTEPIRLTDGKWIYQTPVWSPDGKQIAFVSNRDNTSAIWTISPQGGTPVLKTNLDINFVSCQLLKWSNDTKRLFFQSGRRLKTIELDSGRIEEIKFPVENVGTAFNISADESLAAFVSMSGENQKLWIYNLKKGELTEITNEANLNLFPVILPDNRRIVYSSNQNGNSQLYVKDFISNINSQITFGDSNAYSPVVSPDGNRIVYVSENNIANIFTVDLNSKKELRLTEATKMQLFPALSKDLSNLVFQVAEEYSNFTQSPLKMKNLQTNNERILNGQTGFWAKWSPARDEIAYLRHQGREFNIWKMDFSNNQTKQLTNGGLLIGGYATAPFNMLTIPFNWSPDGRKLTFVSKQSGSENVWMINSDGANQQMLTDNNDQKIGYDSAIWSPDGSKISFVRRIQTEPNKFRYYILVSSNNQVKELFQDNRQIKLLGWGLNGSNLLVAVNNTTKTEIYALSETAEPKLLVKLIKSDFPSLSLSPDGRTIAFSSIRNGVYNTFSYSIHGKEKQLTDNEEDTILFSGISWSPAGDRIFYSKQSGGMQISMISDIPDSSIKTEK